MRHPLSPGGPPERVGRTDGPRRCADEAVRDCAAKFRGPMRHPIGRGGPERSEAARAEDGSVAQAAPMRGQGSPTTFPLARRRRAAEGRAFGLGPPALVRGPQICAAGRELVHCPSRALTPSGKGTRLQPRYARKRPVGTALSKKAGRARVRPTGNRPSAAAASSAPPRGTTLGRRVPKRTDCGRKFGPPLAPRRDSAPEGGAARGPARFRFHEPAAQLRLGHAPPSERRPPFRADRPNGVLGQGQAAKHEGGPPAPVGGMGRSPKGAAHAWRTAEGKAYTPPPASG